MEISLVDRDDIIERFYEDFRSSPAVTYVLVGTPGVGKTRLARALADRTRASGSVIHYLAGSAAGQEVRLGAVSHLISGTRTANGDDVTAARTQLVESAGDRRLVLIIDDAPQVDDESASVVFQLAASEQATVIATGRSSADQRNLDDFVRLPNATVMTLEPVTRGGMLAMAEAALDGPMSDTTADRLWDLTLGNPLYIEGAVTASASSGRLLFRDGLWQVNGEFEPSDRTLRTVTEQLESLNTGTRELIELCCMAGRLELAAAGALFDPVHVENAENSGLIVLHIDRRRQEFDPSHPIVARVARSRVPAARKRRLLRQLVDWLQQTGARRAEDALKLAALAIESGIELDRQEWIAAASEAEAAFDHRGALEMANRALGGGEDSEALIVRGRALRAQGRNVDARLALERAIEVAQDDRQRALSSVALAWVLAFSEDDREGAIASCDRALEGIADPTWRAEVLCTRGPLAAVDGDFSDIRELERELRADEITDPRVIVSAATQLSSAKRDLAEFERTIPLVEETIPVARAYRSHYPAAQSVLEGNLAQLTWLAGDLSQGVRLANEAYLAAADRSDESAGSLALQSVELVLGHAGPEAAFKRSVEAISLLESLDPRGQLPEAIAYSWLIAAQLGRRHETEADSSLVIARSGIVFTRAQLWIDASSVGSAPAAERLREAAAATAAAGQVTLGAIAAFDAVRWGRAGTVDGILREMAAVSDGGLIRMLARHAEASAIKDAEQLSAIAAEHESSGGLVYATDAMFDSAELYRARNDSKAATRAEARAYELAERSGWRAPFGRAAANDHPLSNREREIAALARDGMSSREIADALFISSRTVDNHLASVYRKLGVAGRQHLREALGG